MTTEAKVGAFVLGCCSILAFTVIYLMHAQFSGDTVPYRTYLRYAGGLEPGASVLFGGITVGEVKAVRPWTADPTKIEILLKVKQGTPLNEKSVAKLGLVSLMNSAALSITTGSNDAKRLAFGSAIPSQEVASLDEIAGKMVAVADGANALITQARGELENITGDARSLLANLNTMTGPPTHRKVQAVLDHVNGLLATEGPKIDRISEQLIVLSQHADDTIQHADGTVQNVNGTVTDMREPIRKDLAELQDTLLQAKQLLASMQVMVRANEYKIDDTVENLRVATDNLDQLTDSLKQRPWSLVRIKQPKDRQVQQQK